MHERISRLQDELRADNVDAAVLDYPSDVYYFSGTGTHATLVVPATGEPTLLVRINYDRAVEDSWISDVRESQGTRSVVELVTQEYDGSIDALGIEADVRPVNGREALSGKLPSGTELVDVSETILEIRTVKTESEIADMERAVEISQAVFDRVEEFIETGVTEGAVVSEMERVKRELGAEGEMNYRGWIAKNNPGHAISGPNTAEISGPWISMTGTGMQPGRPWGPSRREIEAGDTVIVDHGTAFDGYHTDEARTFVVGEDDDAVEADTAILCECLEAAKEAIAPGVDVGVPFERAREVAAANDREEDFMALGEYGIEYIGHGVGLEMDEPPLLSPYTDATFSAGMTVTVEPKIIYPDERGTMVEDTVLVTDDGVRTLTTADHELFYC